MSLQAIFKFIRAVVSLIASICGGDVARKCLGFYLPHEPHTATGKIWYAPYYDYPNNWQPGTPGAMLVSPSAPPQWTRFVWSSVPVTYLMLGVFLALSYAFLF